MVVFLQNSHAETPDVLVLTGGSLVGEKLEWDWSPFNRGPFYQVRTPRQHHLRRACPHQTQTLLAAGSQTSQLLDNEK
jgi:hypothetical protein